MTPIAPLIEAFLRETLTRQRGVSRHTQDSYAFSFQLLFEFAAKRLKVPPSALTLEQIDARLVSTFLEYLEDVRHTAREHPTEAKVHYPFHPRCGETVTVRRRLLTNSVLTAVILQPDGSLAFLPAWMMDESAAQFTIHESPTFSLAFLQSLRAEIDTLLTSLPSDSKAGDDGYASKKRDSRKPPAGAVRARAVRSRAVADQEATAGAANRSSDGRDRGGARNRGGRR